MRGSARADLAIIIPSTGRAEQCARLVERIYATARTPHSALSVLVSVEPNDVKPYAAQLVKGRGMPMGSVNCHIVWDQTGGTAGPGSHVAAMNRAAAAVLAERDVPLGSDDPDMIVKMDDDHWPATVGWDVQYLNALDALGGTGVVYGNDLFQGERLPTVPGISSDIVRELGWYAPPQLQHWYCDNFWLELGKRSGRLTYLPETIIEHRHPQAGKGQRDAVYAAGGENAERIAADGYEWAEICEVRDGVGRGLLDQRIPLMDEWAGIVRQLAERSVIS